ncbi:MAG: thioredoxin family protein [Planctomycetia bacterium]|nr:thioredoxin family protein [Planctomycetia bacterium]
MGKTFVRLLALAAILATGFVANAGENSPIGKKIDNFSARDFRGKTTSLADFSQSKVVAVVFLGTECPLAKLYAPRLAELAAEFETRGVAFVAIDANLQDSIADLAHYAQENKLDFPVLKDAGNVIADHLGAARTPEVFVLDQDRVVRYWGRIDDQYGFQEAGVGFQRAEPKRRDLAIALEELLTGKAVSQPIAKNQGCLIGRVKQPVANSDVTYSKHIAAILNNNCVYCHRTGQIAPFPLTSYAETVGWADMIREVVAERRMPPWHADPKVGHFRNDARLSDHDQELINKWVDSGAPEGDPKDLPPARQFAEGWLIPKPDQVIYMGEDSYDVPATGTVEYQRFVVDPGWTEDKWVKAMQCMPGNHSVVHHIIVYLVPPGVTPSGQAGRLRSNWLGAFAPGLRPQVLEEGLARYVQKGSKLLFEVHYTPNGIAQKDRSYVGFVYADPRSVKKEVAVQNAGNFTFKIPPGDPNYEVESEFVFRQNALLLTVSPHMHVRGKDFRYDLIYPDGKQETVLWVPRYDFGWQTTYELTDPKLLPKGTKMHCVAHFDNSADNFANPDPNKEVGWGEQTWEEMMFGWFEMSLADQDLTQPATASAQRVKEFLAQADTTRLDDQLQAMARGALASDKTFERFGWQLFEIVPQLDRICVTAVENDKVRLKMIQERLGLKTSLRSRSTVIKAAGQSLAEYALGDKTVVNDEMGNTKGSIMANMASKDIRSSMHVPVEIGGLRCTINFWSAEAGAFPPEAARLLEQAARLMAEGAKIAGK